MAPAGARDAALPDANSHTLLPFIQLKKPAEPARSLSLSLPHLPRTTPSLSDLRSVSAAPASSPPPHIISPGASPRLCSPPKDEKQKKGGGREIDTSLEKISKLTDAEDQKDTNSFGDSNEALDLRPLVQELYMQYQSLYGHYDDLIGKLKKKVHHDGESNGQILASSSSSDSDSSDSESSEFNKKKITPGAEEGNVKEEKILIEECQYLREELERLKIRNAEMEMEALSMVSKIKEAESLATTFAEREAAYFSLEDELNDTRERNERLQIENDDLKRECNQKEVLTSQRLQLFIEEKEALLLEKSMALDRLEEAGKYVEDFKVKVEHFKDEISQLQTDNGSLKNAIEILEDELGSMKESSKNLQVENEDLKQELQSSNRQVADLIQRVKTFEEDNSTLRSDMLQNIAKMKEAEKVTEDLRSELELLKDEKSKLLIVSEDLNRLLGVKDDEKASLSLDYDELVIKVKQMQENIEMMSKELDGSNVENTQLKDKYEALQLDLIQRVKTFEEDNSTLRSDMLQNIAKMKEAEKVSEDLRSELELLKDEKSKLLIVSEDLNRLLGVKDDEKASLSLDYNELVIKVKQMQENIEMMSKELDGSNVENTQLKDKYEALQLDLIQRVKTFEEDNSTLRSDMLQNIAKMKEAEKVSEDLRSELELLKDEKSKLLIISEDLNQLLGVKDDEKASLSLDYDELVVKVKQMQENIEMMSKELHRSNVENTQLKDKYEALQLEFEDARSEVSDMRRLLQVTQEERSVITEEKSVLFSKIEEFERMMDELKAEKHHLESDNSALNNKIDDLVHKLESIEEGKNTLASEKLVMLSKLEQTESSIKETLNEVEQLRRENCLFQKDQLESQQEISELGRRLESKEGEIADLQKILDEASSRVQIMTTNAGDMQQKLNLAHNKINDLEEQLKIATDMALEKQDLMEKLENELKGELLTRETVMKDQKNNLEELLAKHALLENQLQESCIKLEIADGKLAEMKSKDETIQLLNSVGQEQKLRISQLEGNLMELSEKLKLYESEKAELDKENMKLCGQVQILEVQIRLANQKLKITETENKEKEESYKRAMVLLQEERRKLEEQTSTLSWKLNLMEDDFNQVKELVQVEMQSLFGALNALDVKLAGQCVHIQNKISGCSNDVKLIKDGITALIYTREGLKNEKRDLSMRLNYKEGIISMIKDEAGMLGSKLATKTKEEERLVLKVSELEKRVRELENRVKEKEEELFSKDEEKREAIRQLCVLVEYHRENCNHLYKFLSATLKRVTPTFGSARRPVSDMRRPATGVWQRSAVGTRRLAFDNTRRPALDG
ncbi:hypothetical protein Taro_008252 [Colocasia esculenta]|uniref:NAB domain-containing protein n=1 Tax=Colocasia esculenta TaxID=4460 RepID=A0A843U2U2_COLES|nr:hypothetical protein [Colocasia esculenta]